MALHTTEKGDRQVGLFLFLEQLVSYCQRVVSPTPLCPPLPRGGGGAVAFLSAPWLVALFLALVWAEPVSSSGFGQ